MPDHYPDHPVLNDLPPEPESNLFDEMDAIADALHKSPLHNCDDDQIAFRQLQKARRPDLEQSLRTWFANFAALHLKGLQAGRDHYALLVLV